MWNMNRNLLFLVLFVLSSCSWLPAKLSPEHQVNDWRVLWAQNLDPDYVSGNLPIGLGAPTTYQHLLYMGTAWGEMRAYDVETGRVVWTAKEEGKYLGAPGSVFEEHLIYGSTDGRVYSRHTMTGELNWSIDLQSSVETAPSISKGRAYFHLRNHKIVCLDAGTGKIIWSYKRSVPYTTTIQRASRPLVLDDRVVVGMADGFLVAIHPEEGNILWETLLTRSSKFVDVDADPLLLDGLILAGPLTGPLSLVDPKSGVVRRTMNYKISRAPLYDENFVYLGTMDGEVVKLKRQSYDELFRLKVSKRSLSAMSWWQGELAVSSTKGELFLLNPADLKLKSSYHLGSSFSAIFGELVEHGDFLATLSSRNRLYVFTH